MTLEDLDREMTSELDRMSILISEVREKSGIKLTNDPFREKIESACRAWWDTTANIRWDVCPEEWKPFYRAKMEAALKSIGVIE